MMYIHEIDPFLIRFPSGFFLEGIRWYGLAYLMSFLSAFWMLKVYCKRGYFDLNTDQQNNLLLVIIMGVLLGGRFGYMIFYDWQKTCQDFLGQLSFWRGISGMSSHGGFIGVAIATVFVSRKYKLPLLRLADLIVVLTPTGLFFGRIANFINGELCGRITNVSWAVIFPKVDYFPRHPSQLYEAFLEGFLLLLYTQFRFRSNFTNKLYKSENLVKPGQLTAEFFILYAILRFFVEYFREPDASLIGIFTRGQFYSIGILVFGIGLFFFAKFMKKKEICEKMKLK